MESAIAEYPPWHILTTEAYKTERAGFFFIIIDTKWKIIDTCHFKGLNGSDRKVSLWGIKNKHGGNPIAESICTHTGSLRVVPRVVRDSRASETRARVKITPREKRRTWVNCCWVCAAGLSKPLPYYSLFCGQLYMIIVPIFVTFGQICNFRDPNLVTFYFYELIYFLDWMKNTLLFICSTNFLVRLVTVNMKNCLTPKNQKMCDPILVTLLKSHPIIVNPVVKMRSHSSAHLN